MSSACAGTTAAGPSRVATETEWRALAPPRPALLDGAPRVSVSEVEFLGAYPWTAGGTVSAALGVEELVVTNLLRRRDVRFVDRRRFSAAADAERRGVARARGQPPAGVSTSAEFAVTAVWITLGPGQESVEVRLAGMSTGDVVGATRVSVAEGTRPVALSRAIVQGILTVLNELDRLPNWEDPLASANDGDADSVSDEALRDFLRGLAAEELWNWEEARRGYQAAAADPAFYEATAALARSARLRLGGTLAES